MSQNIQAISANSTGSNRSTRSSTTSNKASKVGKLEKRAIEGHAKKLALLEGYKKLLKIIKMAEKYYETPLQNEMKRKVRLEQSIMKDYLGSKKIYKNLPNIKQNMTNKQINEIIKKQKTKMKQGILRGAFTNFRVESDELARLKKQKASTTNQMVLLRSMRNDLLNKHSNHYHFKNADLTINQFLKHMVIPLKESFKRYEKTTQNMILRQQAKNKAKDEKQKKQAELQKYKKFVKLFKAKQEKIVKARIKSKENKAKQANKNALKEAKESEKAARQEAKDADIERKKAIRNEKAIDKARKEEEKEARRVEREKKAADVAAEKANKKFIREAKKEEAARKATEKELRKTEREAKEAIKQAEAAILKAGIQMSSKKLS